MLSQPDVTLFPNARRGEPEGRWASPWTVVGPRQFANFSNTFLYLKIHFKTCIRQMNVWQFTSVGARRLSKAHDTASPRVSWPTQRTWFIHHLLLTHARAAGVLAGWVRGAWSSADVAQEIGRVYSSWLSRWSATRCLAASRRRPWNGQRYCSPWQVLASGQQYWSVPAQYLFESLR